MEQVLAGSWRRIIVGAGKSWVVLSRGTCVIFRGASDDITQKALAIMRDWGPVRVGGAAGDFGVITLNDELGWVVTCLHPDVLTYVSPCDLPSDPSEMQIGLLGRGRRDADARELKIIHIEESTSD